MASRMKNLGIDRLNVDERLNLMHETWESVAAEPGRTHMSDVQRTELERRLAEAEANPPDVVPWEEVRTEALSRSGQ